MKLLFINVASKVFHDKNGKLYLNPHITNKGFKQYLKFCDEFTMLLRDGGEIDNPQQFEEFDYSIGKLVIYPDPYKVKTFINPKVHLELNSIIEKHVKEADKVICGSQGSYVIDLTVKFCNKFHKLYMIYCLGMMFEGQWHHSLKGKLVALPREYSCIKNLKNAPYVIYVTQQACQKRYPCKGKTLGCSDVELPNADINVLQKRLNRIQSSKTKIIFGTSAYLDVKWKGHHVMLKALAVLKKQGYPVQYNLIGSGTGDNIRHLAKKLKIEDCITIHKAVPHEQIFSWYDDIDIYVQPSFQEGLCRSIVEAMSRACPIVCSDVGGNYELIDKDFLFKAGNYHELTERLVNIIEQKVLEWQAKRNFEKAKEYQSDVLNSRRWKFIQEFIEDNNT